MAGETPANKTDTFITASDLKEVLECPVCCRVPRSAPVYQCERGHVVCKDCHPKLTICPMCRLPLGRTRSLISEKVLTKLPNPCKYSDHGCETEMMVDQLVRHEKECSFRLVSCVDLACGQKISLNKLMNHVVKDHEREDFVNADGSSYKSHFIVHDEDFGREIMWISDNLQLEGRNFFRECCRSTDGLWYVWMYLVGSPADALQYKCSIKIYSGEDELIFKGRVISVDIPKEEVAKSGAGLVFPDATAKLFWKDQKIHYSVSVESKHKSKKTSVENSSPHSNKDKVIPSSSQEEAHSLTGIIDSTTDNDNVTCSKNKQSSHSADINDNKSRKDKKKKKSVRESSC